MDWLSGHAWEAWLILALVLAALELVSLDVVMIMLAGGALVGVVAALLGGPLALQVVLAVITSLALLGMVRPSVVRRLHRGPDLRTGVDALIGRRARTLSELSSDQPGRVKIGGEEWTAEPYAEDEVIPAGETVDVVHIKGATAYVMRVQRLPSGEAT